MVTKTLDLVIKVTNKNANQLNQVNKSMNNVDKSVGKINKRLGTFDMRLLSLLFGGMALQRAFGRVLRSVFDTFKRAEDSTSGLNQATVRLSASWEFLKFSIIDALNTDFFIGMIDGLIRFINRLSQLDSKFKVAFLTVSSGLFIIGGAMLIIGQFKLAWDSIMGTEGLIASVAKVTGLNGLGAIFLAFLAIGLVVIAFKKDFKGMSDLAKEVWEEIKLPLKNIFDELGTLITQTTGIEDSWDFLALAGISVFSAIALVVFNTLTIVEQLIRQFGNLANILLAIGSGKFAVAGILSVKALDDARTGLQKLLSGNKAIIDANFAAVESLKNRKTEPDDSFLADVFGGGNFFRRPGDPFAKDEFKSSMLEIANANIDSGNKIIEQNEKQAQSWIDLKKARDEFLETGSFTNLGGLVNVSSVSSTGN